jgi:hypothetical protein
MLRRVLLFILMGASLFLSSCALLPYSEHFSCQKGRYAGYCGSIDRVYKYVNGGEK